MRDRLSCFRVPVAPSLVAVFSFLALLTMLPVQAGAQERFGVALVADDETSEQSQRLNEILRSELEALTEGEFLLEFKVYAGDWSPTTITSALEEAYADPQTDLVLVTGLFANQILGTRAEYPKPTFLPLVFDAEVLGLPRGGIGSGRTNLSYVADDLAFDVDLEAFSRVADFRSLGILADGAFFDAIGGLPDEVIASAAELGVKLSLIPFRDPNDDLVSLIPADVEAVMVGGLGRASSAAIDRLVDGLIERRLPSFSFDGEEMVERGLLTTHSASADIERLARRNALNVQAVILGERAEDLPVDFEAKHRLYINLMTAEAIGTSPSFGVLIEAVLIGELKSLGKGWSLGEVAASAVEENLDLLAQRYGTAAGVEAIREARASLFPELSASINTTQLDGSGLNVAAGAAERSTTGSLVVSQLLWSEPVWANLDIQEFLQQGREAELERLRLDTVQAATVSFLDLLRAETQIRVQRDNLELTRANLELAKDRVRVGSSTVADVYRWQSQLATARQAAIAAYSAREQAQQKLNRILHRPIDERIHSVPATLDDPALMFKDEESRRLIDNPRSFRAFADWVTEVGLEHSPELASLASSVRAKKRELESNQRAFYSPSVSLQGQWNSILEEDRAGPSLAGEGEWSVAVVGSLPLWTGGSRKAAVARNELELKQLETQVESLREQIEQGIRFSVQQTNASYLSIPLAQEAAEAARKNLDLVSDAYSAGAVSILDLLDAQSATLQAEESAATAGYAFLIDLMNVQRSAGQFDFFLEDSEREQMRQLIQSQLGSGSSVP